MILVLAGCLRDNRDTANTASVYTSNSDSSAKEDSFPDTNGGFELEAPRLIPAMRNQLELMSKAAQPVNRDNLTAYKNLAGDLVNSMAADLNRVGYADSGGFKALSDSVMDDLRGTAESESSLVPGRLDQHVSRLRRLITLYQQVMRNPSDRL